MPQRIAGKIDGDIDAHVRHKHRRLAIAHGVDVVEAVESGNEALAQAAAVVRPERNSDHLETAAVMPLDQFGDQLADGMLAKIRREIRDLDALVPPSFPGDDRRRRVIDLVVDITLGAGKLERLVIAVADEDERRHDGRTVSRATACLGAQFVLPSPVAEARGAFDDAAECVRMVGIDRERAFIARGRFADTLQMLERMAPAAECIGVVGLERDGTIEACQRGVMTMHVLERKAAIVVGERASRPQREGAVVARDRRIESHQRLQGIAAVAPGVGIVGPQREHAVIAGERLLMPLECGERVATIGNRIDVIGIERQHAVVTGERLERSLELFQRNAAVVENADVVGAQGEREIAGCERLVVAFEVAQHHGAVVQRLEVAGHERERLLAALQCLVEQS